ncbi:TrmB family transcriptional regulator [Candidatus Roizmanbacteria bacterium]|nr:TrmB family transcriptional regulator [Candidatus Roizmanbacteria bacterium]
MDTVFANLGLSQEETAIYTTLCKEGPIAIRSIAVKTGINRGTVYETLKLMAKTGLVTYSPIGKRKNFVAESPEKLLALFSERKKRMEEAIKKLEVDVIPDLKTHSKTGQIPQVYYYEGDEGIEQVLKDVLQTVQNSVQKEYFIYSSRPVRKYLYKLFPNFTRQRVRRGIKVKVIAIGEGGEEAELAERKWIKADENGITLSYMIIYPPKFALISVAQEDLPYGVVIHEEGVAKTQKVIFDTLWKIL